MSAIRPLPLIQERESMPATSKTKRKGSAQCHRGGEILNNFSAHLLSPPGGRRSEGAVKQIVTSLRKYLYFLNPERVEVEGLALHASVMSYLKDVERQGVRCSSVLHEHCMKSLISYMAKQQDI